MSLLPALALAGCEPAPASLTTDRLSQDRMAALVAGPMASVRAGDLARAEAELAAMIARARPRAGGHSIAEFDLLTAFSIGLVIQEQREPAGAYMARALDVGRRVFGPRHPETAVAAHSYAHIIDPTAAAPPPPKAVALMEEALSIRRETLGPRNVETLATIGEVASMKTRLVAGGDRTAAQRAEALLLELLPLAEAEEQGLDRKLPPPETLRRHLATVYASTGRATDLMRLIEEGERQDPLPPSNSLWGVIDLFYRETRELVQRQKPGGDCILYLDMFWGEQIDLLEKNGQAQAAEAIRRRECPPPSTPQVYRR
jgi:hypothetical protein